MVRYLKSAFTATLLLAGSIVNAQGYDFSDLTALLEKHKKDLGNDFVVIVNKDGKDIYKKEFGELKATMQEPVGASSNWLTAALVMHFVDEGKLSLDDKIGDYLPIYGSYSKGYITLRQCLSHTTTIESDPPSIRTVLKKKKFETLEDETNSYAKDRNMMGKQGTQFYYGQVGPAIAGRILEVVSKRNFDRLMRERIGKGLGWRRTTFMSDGLLAENPFSGGKTTADDYMKFLNMLLNKGMFNGKQVISEKSVEEILKMQTGNARIAYTLPVAQGAAYGLGCFILPKDDNNADEVFFSPSLSGTWPWINRTKRYSAIIFTKGDAPDAKRVIMEEIRQVIEQKL
ncbi:beta-lactamase family protein [Flavihumibacter rivuli]|uniref:serine hydrolase domain-containing protein n=1 Tax=Flavihumibacter rivuli TaxID=2838156 RepID=UPI001BDE6B62|nr:serine hydrolase domain-containing protein [Flavihumibacter rivuli]ULQ57353.1 beta-lactamase family protein [Flavihumibacter rivuli]